MKLLLLLPVLALSAEPNHDDSGRIFFSSDVPAQQSTILIEDLRYLEKTRSKAPEQNKLGLESWNGASLSHWLAERVQYIVGQGFAPEFSVSSISPTHEYENPGIFPDKETATRSPEARGDKPRYVVMANMGPAFYAYGKEMGDLFGAELDGIGMVPIKSPRVGLLLIGEGLFKPLLERSGWAGQDMNSEAYRIVRLGALFHEARHSDGNGKSLGFHHAVCPDEHDYAGLLVCDRSSNGSYTIGGTIEKSLSDACETCSIGQREALRLYTLDSFNRVIPGAPDLDATPEGIR